MGIKTSETPGHKTEEKNLAFICDTLIWKICISTYIKFYTLLDLPEFFYFNSQTFKTFVQIEINKFLHDSVVESRHLVAGFENNWAGGSRFERVGSQNFFRNRQISSETSATSSTCFWDPHAPLGTKSSKNSNTGTPSKMALFQKKWLKRVKEYPFNLFTERAIVEGCVAVILPPQLTL